MQLSTSMYLRRCYRKEDGKRHSYWALVGLRQRVVAYLGEMDEAARVVFSGKLSIEAVAGSSRRSSRSGSK